MINNYEEIIRLSYWMWEREGRPDGESVEPISGMKIKDIHWRIAESWIMIKDCVFNDRDIDMDYYNNVIPLVKGYYEREHNYFTFKRNCKKNKNIEEEVKHDLELLHEENKKIKKRKTK